MYHTAIALRNAASTLSPQHRDALRDAITDALNVLPQQETNTREILNQALQSVSP